ncbi:MAG TPA: hydroxymethylbilane synthase [Abditibacteriaceae bacterium]|nr:hydroxymethylbilane synthase [Abditibacteriaceae bacterium]
MTHPLSTPRLVMGTRGSALALAQSRQVAAALQAAQPGLTIEERVIRTTGDKLQNASLPAIGGKGVFTLEIEQALLNGEIDFAVHSLKDLPPQLPPGLTIAAIPARASASDVCVLHSRWSTQPTPQSPQLEFLPVGACIGTSSLRRRAQLLHLRPDLRMENLRGNIDTRLRKLEEQGLDAIVLAYAGLNRLGVVPQLMFPLDERKCVPAPGQGALAIEARGDDEQVAQMLSTLDDAATRAEVTAERATMRALNAGCSTPLGARAVVDGDVLRMWAVILSPDGRRRIFAEAGGATADAASIGESVAQQLITQGARELLPAVA